MEKHRLGKTGLEVSPIAFGGMEMRRCAGEQTGKALLYTALELGINYIDTSPEYLHSEEWIGQSIAHRRSEYFLATKCGDTLLRLQPEYEFNRKVMMTNLENSLRQLKTDYIDVWQLHAGTPQHFPKGEMEEAVEVMLQAKKAGKVRFLGVTMRNGKPHETGYPAGFGYYYAPFFGEWECIDVLQVVYGGMTRLAEQVIAELAQRGKGVVVRGALKCYREEALERFRQAGMQELFAPGEDEKAFLLRYAMSHPGVGSVVIGTTSEAHLRQNVAAAEQGPLSPQVYAEAQKRLAQAGLLPGTTFVARKA